MRKSSLILLLAMAFVLTTVAAGFSSSIVDGPCKEICKDWHYGLQLDLTYDCNTPYQGTATCPPCPQFDYESARGYCTTMASPGSVSEYNAHGIIMKVCDCPDPNFDITKSYGIRIEIVEPATGVYFTNSNTSGADYTCATGCANGIQNIYVSAIGDTTDESRFCPYPCVATAPAAAATAFVMAYEPVNSGKVLFDPATHDKQPDPVTGDREECCLDCIGNLAKSIQTTCVQPFMVANSPYLMIDVPTMVWDPKIIAEGDEVVLKVIITGETDAAVCPTCNDLCDCTVKVGIFGCEKAIPASKCYTCFPYLTAVDDEAWWAGLALTNAGSRADVVIEFYAGGESVSVNIPLLANSVTVYALSQISELSALAGKGPIYAQAISTVPTTSGGTIAAQVTGFAIMGDGTQAYGYLTKCGLCGCNDCD
ncbi:MAG: hypothetical protein J7J71_05715 [Deltaproteobacteria bacterium]|nr:hypothetical protein [Candidatus Tharpella sp.]